MKKFLFIITALVLFSCAKDSVDQPQGATADNATAKITNSAEGAVAGVLTIKVAPEVADRIETTQAQSTRSGEALTRAGISDMDLVFDKIGVEHFTRTFPYEKRFEERHRAFGLHRWYTLRFDTAEGLAASAQMLSQVAGISVIEFHHRIKSLKEGRMVPYNKANVTLPQTRVALPMNDPKLAAQWHYHNTGVVGQTTGGNRFYAKEGADISLYDAWTLCTGSPEIIVAVIDEPVQYTHPDLTANMWVNPNPGGAGDAYQNDIHGYNFFNKTSNIDWKSSAYDSDYGVWMYADHGTHVAGTVAAVNGNNLGVCGIAGGTNGSGGVKIMTCQIMGYNEDIVDENAGAKAFVYAADRGALIAQCSWGYGPNISTQAKWMQNDDSAEKNAIDYFITHAGTDNPSSPLKGGLVIFAAGNDGDSVGDQMMWPGAYEPTVAVAAMAADYTPAYYTNYGKWVDITAPGGDRDYGDTGNVLSTILLEPNMLFQDGRDNSGLGYMQGTSMACPHISGIAALGLSYASKMGKQYTLAQFKAMLLQSVDVIDTYMTGSRKFYDNYRDRWSTMNLGNYKLKMGSGYSNAYRLLLEIKGAPSLYIQQNKSIEIDLSKYFHATASNITCDNSQVAAKLGMSTPVINNGKMTFSCSQCGAGTITLTSTRNGVSHSKEIAIIVREVVADNGGWL